MSRSGIRPVPEQKGRPVSKVTTWIIDTYGEVAPDGRPLPRQRPRFQGTVKEARAARQRLVADLIAQLPASPAPAPEGRTEGVQAEPVEVKKELPTFREFVKETYLPWVKSRAPESTYLTKARHFSNHIVPTLGDLPLDQANTRAAVQKLKLYLIEHPRIRKNSFRSLILLTFSAALAHAADPDDGPGLIPEKVRVKLFPEEDEQQGVPIAGFRAGYLRHKRFSDDELARLLITASAMSPPAWWRVLVMLGAAAGCRVGEAAARRWDDIDWANREIRIGSKICTETDKEVGRTKNKVTAAVPLSDELLDALQSLRRTPGSLKSPYILGPGEERPYLTTRNIHDRFAILTTKAFGKASRNYHRLRHTCASTLSDRGVPAEQLRIIMRHKSLKTTYGYIQPSRSSLQEAIRGLTFLPHAAE